MYTFTNSADAAASHAPLPSDSQDFLVFQLGCEQFCIDIHVVRECAYHKDLAGVMDGRVRVPGVRIWRGKILPCVDLRAGFHDALDEPAAFLILALGNGMLAVAVDATLDVIRLASWQIAARPAQGGLIGVSTYRGRRLHIFDAGALFAGASLAQPHMLAA